MDYLWILAIIFGVLFATLIVLNASEPVPPKKETVYVIKKAANERVIVRIER